MGKDMKIQWIDRCVRAEKRPNPAVYRAKRELATITHRTSICVPRASRLSKTSAPHPRKDKVKAKVQVKVKVEVKVEVQVRILSLASA